MRKTFCLNCHKTWQEPRTVELKDSKCPYCGKSVINIKKKKHKGG